MVKKIANLQHNTTPNKGKLQTTVLWYNYTVFSHTPFK